MYLLITYDVATSTPAGARRLRRIAKICLDYGQRVQNSVFECQVDPSQWVQMRQKLLKEMNPNEDSLRFYQLGNHWQRRVEHHGTKPSYDPSGPLVL